MISKTVRRAAQIFLPACLLLGSLSAQSLTILCPGVPVCGSSPSLPPASVSVSYPAFTLSATGLYLVRGSRYSEKRLL